MKKHSAFCSPGHSAPAEPGIPRRRKAASGHLAPSETGLRWLNSSFPPAFTLIEMVIVIVLLTLTAGITTHYLVSASQLYALLLAHKQADSEVMDAANRMRREARLHVQTLTADSNKWTFSNTYDATNTFLWSGVDVKLNGNYLAKGIDRFTLSYYDATNGLLEPLPLTNCAGISRVALDIRAANDLADSELKVNFFMQEDLLK